MRAREGDDTTTTAADHPIYLSSYLLEDHSLNHGLMVRALPTGSCANLVRSGAAPRVWNIKGLEYQGAREIR